MKRYIFLDDLCGSGQQSVEYTETLLQDLRDVAKQQGPEIEVIYLVLFGNSDGLQHARDASDFDRVDAVCEFDPSFKTFATNSRCFNPCPTEVDKSLSQAIFEDYGKTLVPSHPLGYKDGQLLLAFHHNVPDNTLPVIWSSRMIHPLGPLTQEGEQVLTNPESHFGNPFQITKATDFTDDEINETWVDVQTNAIRSLLHIDSTMPRFLVGGKGADAPPNALCVFDAASYIQRSKPDDIVGSLREEGYLGIYFLCSGLNSNRFRGKGQDEEAWEGVFAYYFDLWISQRMLEVVSEVFDFGGRDAQLGSAVVASTLAREQAGTR